ncbi:DUF6222 family protein [Amycolatopsis suaedae]|uniref:Uncharacterized protein n=1 Tax=Amycolatopsis suaedae TaxID=2510978 RepID=A0A4Q7J2J5_9PSEU|nr:DUF6222 family protein [Amycolatopsis suaedae]RZQ61129.1 hypothetical protein EWH70_24910 [Amycolatopsis suaedae]
MTEDDRETSTEIPAEQRWPRPAAVSDYLPPVSTHPQLGAGVVWSEVVARIEADHRERLARRTPRAA